jgi:fibronectin-binding autotransporter adhesin
VLVMILAAAALSPGAQLTWDVDGTAGAPTGGAGDWDTSNAYWDTGSGFVAWNNTTNATDTAVFGGTAGQVDVTTNITAGALKFDAANYVMKISGGKKLYISDVTGAQKDSVKLTGGNGETHINVAPATTLAWSPIIQAGTELWKEGDGTLEFGGTLPGNNNSHYALNITDGTFKLIADIPDNRLCGRFRVSNGGTMDLDTYKFLGIRKLNVEAGGTLKGQAGSYVKVRTESSTYAGSIEGGLTLWLDDNGPFTFSSSNPLWTGDLKSDKSSGTQATINITNDGALQNAVLNVGRATVNFLTATPSVAGLATPSGGGAVDTVILGDNVGLIDTELNLTGGGVYVFDRQIAESTGQVGSIRKTGTGTQTFNRASSYSGGTIVEAGTLIANDPAALGTGDVTVGKLGTLQLNFDDTLADTAIVTLEHGSGYGLLYMDFQGTDDVLKLFFNDEPQPIGTYGAPGSGAEYMDDNWFAGAGVLNVLETDAAPVIPEPVSALAILTALGALGGYVRRRRR